MAAAVAVGPAAPVTNPVAGSTGGAGWAGGWDWCLGPAVSWQLWRPLTNGDRGLRRRWRCSGRRAEIERLATARGASNIRVFGSVARGDAGPDSDIDLIVDFTPRHSGLDLVALADELEQLLGYRVEVGARVHSSIRDRVERQLVDL